MDIESLVWLVIIFFAIGNGLLKLIKERKGGEAPPPADDEMDFEMPDFLKRALPTDIRKMKIAEPVEESVNEEEMVEPEAPPAVVAPPVPEPLSRSSVITAPVMRLTDVDMDSLMEQEVKESTFEHLVQEDVQDVKFEHVSNIMTGNEISAPAADIERPQAPFDPDDLLKGVAMSVILGPPKAKSRRLYMLGRKWRPAP